MDNKLSLLDLPYDGNGEPVYTSAFDRPTRKRDGFVVKIRNNIFGRNTKKR
jgi:hypothetical protein